MADLTWRLYVYQPDGAIRSLLSPATASITSFGKISVAASGDCREMEFDALPSEFSGKARDRILFQVSTDGGSIYRSLFRGVITVAGDPRADTVRTYRAVGLSKRYEETLVEDVVIPGADVRSMAIDVVSSGTIPDGVHPFILTNFPGFSFSLGDRYPGRETKADALRALAAAVGAFIVPAGETYTYDGVTYSAGEAVPPARWGIDADGNPFFRRPQAAPLYLDEASRRVEVVWTRVSGETVFDRVSLVYPSTYNGENVEEVAFVVALGEVASPRAEEIQAVPIVRSFGSGDYEAERRVEPDVQTVRSLMVDGHDSTFDDGNWTNASNAFDGDDATYAEGTAGTLPDIDAYRTSGPFEALARVKFEKEAKGDRSQIEIRWGAGGAGRGLIRYDFADLAGGTPVEFLAPMPIPAFWESGTPFGAISSLTVSYNGENRCKVYAIEILVPGVDEAGSGTGEDEKYARSFYKSPASHAAEVRYQGLGPVTQSLTLTPADGGADLDLTIERVEFRVTVEGGMETVYFVGEAFDADLEAERALIGQIAREATE